VTEYAKSLKLWREGRGILRFVADNFKVDLDPWQEKALLLFASPRVEDRRIALQACTGPGKSAVLSWAGWWFMGTQGDTGEHPNGLVTSITGENLNGNLWKEYAKWQGRSPYLLSQFTWTSTAIFASAPSLRATWRLEARSWPKTANPEEQGRTFSGLHGKYVLVQVDEGGAIPPTVLRAAEQALVICEFGKILVAGNPISLEGMLYTIATRLRHQWQIIKITGDPDDPEAWVHSKRAEGSLEWCRQQIEIYGRDNPWVMSYILGQFPPSSINALLGVEEVEAAMKRVIRPEDYEWAEPRLGVDVARFGDDRNVIFPRQGKQSWKPIILRNVKSTIMAAAVARAMDAWATKTRGAAPATFVDDTGHWGHAVIDILTDTERPAYPVVFSDKAIDPRFFNRRAEIHMKAAEWVKAGGALPNVPELVNELTCMTYTMQGGKFRLEEKDQIKRRLGRSPDLADGFALTFAMPDAPRGMRRKRGKAKIDYDPYDGTGHAETDWDPFAGGNE
jgi:hypothetical protein